MLDGFKKFIMRGNVVDLAVGIVIGAAFTVVINSFVNDVLMAIIGAIFGKPNFNDLTFTVGDGVVYYGRFLTALLSFIITAAALLANVGLWLSHSRHHQHSYYMIRNSEHLSGFTDREIELVAQIARYHRKSAPSVERHPAFAALDERDRQIVRALAGVLRVAIGLDRSHAELVQGVEARVEKESVSLLVSGSDPDVDLSLEIWSAQQRVGLLEEVLGRTVVIEAASIEEEPDVGADEN